MQALFKARFEQALESQKLNIKKIEQQLRRMGVNPEDPVAMASIQRVASTFFNAIDQKEGSPYVFRGDKEDSVLELRKNIEESEPPVDSDQEELDKFIAEIEDAADKEWADEEAAEKEELGKLRYWNREDFTGRFRRSENFRNNDPDDNFRGTRGWKDNRGKNRIIDNDDEHDDNYEVDASDLESDADDSDEAHNEFNRSRVEKGQQDKIGRAHNFKGLKRNTKADFNRKLTMEDSESGNMLSDLENAMWQSESEEEHDARAAREEGSHNYMSHSEEEDDFYTMRRNEKNEVNGSGHNAVDSRALNDLHRHGRQKEKQDGIGKRNGSAYFKRNSEANSRGEMAEKDSGFEDLLSDSEVEMLESDSDDKSRTSMTGRYSYTSGGKEYYHLPKNEKNEVKKTPKQVDETWDSD